MAVCKGFRDLEVWQKGMDLAVEVYRIMKVFPREEQFGLTSQMRRAAASIPADIAEGQARSHGREFQRFVSMALGSDAELQTHLELAVRLEYLEEATGTQLQEKTNTMARMLQGLHRSLNSTRPISS